MIYLKKAKKATMIGIIVATALVLLMACFPNVVNASQDEKNRDTSAVSIENKTTKKERKGQKSSAEKKVKFENLTDEEKENLKAKRETKKTEKKAKFENKTDEEKETLKNKKAEKRERKSNNAVNSLKLEQ